MNGLIDSGEIKENTVLKATETMVNDIGPRKIVIILAADILGQSGKIGEPKKFGGPASQQTTTTSSAAPAPAAPVSRPAVKATPQASRGPSVARSPDLGCTPIMQINPYANRWKIKGRITDISKMKTWSNARGDGKLFSITILDKHGDDIKGTFFNDTAAKFHPEAPEATQALQKGAMYTFTGGRVKVANAKWNTCKSEYEISFNNNCEIIQVQDDGDVQKVSYERFMIDQIENTQPGYRRIDILGVVLNVDSHSTFTSKKGNELTKRELTVADESGASVRVTLWGELAFTPDENFENNPVVLITKCNIGDYGGRSLSSAFNGSSLEFNPTFCHEMADVKGWYDSGGSDNVKALSNGGAGASSKGDSVENRKRISDIESEGLGMNAEKGDFISVKAYLSVVKTEKWCYPADPENRKKLTWDASGGDNGIWRNEVTGHEFDKPDWSYCLQCKIEDYTGTQYCTAFNRDISAPAIVGFTAPELKKMQVDSGGDELNDAATGEARKALEKLQFRQHRFVLLCKMDTRQEEPQKSCNIYKVEKLDNWAEENRKLLDAIEQYDNM
jgi:replication factor A1